MLSPGSQAVQGQKPADRFGSQVYTSEVQLKPMRILIADDHDFVRLGLKQLLTAQPGWEICAEAKTGGQAVTLAKQFEPHVVVMDIGMPELNGLEATRRICKLLPDTKVVIFTMHFSDQVVLEIIDAGARGYITKSDAGHELVDFLEGVVEGDGSACRCRYTETLHDRLRAVMAGANRHAIIVQDRAHVVRVNPRDDE